jgi:antitoxin FitA
MSRMIQIRNVPDELHRKLKAKAALEGKTLSDYLLHEVERLAELPSVAELRKRLAERQRPKLRLAPARAVRREREGR